MRILLVLPSLLIAAPCGAGELASYGITEAPYGAHGRSVVAHVVIKAPPQAVFDTLKDVERFPEFFPFVESARILERRENSLRVEYYAHYARFVDLKSVTERSWDEPRHVTSSTPSGLLRGSTATWTLVPHPDGTDLHYRNSVNVTIPVPGYVASFLVNRGLPEMLENLKRRIESGNRWRKGASAAP